MSLTPPPEPLPESAWRTAPAPLLLHPREVHVWRAGLDLNPEALGPLQQTLSSDEQARAARFHFPADRSRYAAARGILRTLMARYLGTSAERLQFIYNAHGKPILAPGGGTGDLRFNLSHSRGLALFAFAAERDVGIDLEYIRPSLTDTQVAERFFSTREVADLRALPEDVQTEAFFRCWTHLPITGDDDPEAGGWSLRALDPGGGYVAAVAAKGADWSPALWQWV